MAFFSALRAAGAALTAQRLRADLIANNIANMNTTRTAEGGPYRRQQAIFAARQEQVPFGDLLFARGMAGPAAGSAPSPRGGVDVIRVSDDGRPPKRVFEPDHPDANAEGYVEYPDIDPVTEMADMMSATRAYEANVTTLNAAKGMALKALEIGR
jgi:flagellar basal-body rod protein FlgC